MRKINFKVEFIFCFHYAATRGEQYYSPRRWKLRFEIIVSTTPIAEDKNTRRYKPCLMWIQHPLLLRS